MLENTPLGAYALDAVDGVDGFDSILVIAAEYGWAVHVYRWPDAKWEVEVKTMRPTNLSQVRVGGKGWICFGDTPLDAASRALQAALDAMKPDVLQP